MTMQQHNHIDRISIQVGLSGYSFRIWSGIQEYSSKWLSADRIFTTPELQRRYEEVELSVFTPKATLVPSQFFVESEARTVLSEVADIEDTDPVDFVPIPEQAAVLIFSTAIGETLSKVICETVLRPDGTKARILPEMYFMLREMPSIKEYNKILASYMDGVLYLLIAQGKSLLLCNSFQAPDFTTAQYFIFLSMKKLQLNPEVSTICLRTPLAEEDEMSLYRYFKSVEKL